MCSKPVYGDDALESVRVRRPLRPVGRLVLYLIVLFLFLLGSAEAQTETLGHH